MLLISLVCVRIINQIELVSQAEEDDVAGWFQGLAGVIRRRKSGRRKESIFTYFPQIHLSNEFNYQPLSNL